MLRSFVIGLFVFASGAACAQSEDDTRWAIVIHGGAGVIERGDMDAETEAAYRDALDAALSRGAGILSEGGSALDAVEHVIRGLEDDPKFNAGRGAVFTAAGRNELDSSIMRGSDRQAGAAAGVTTVRHPISLARAVMEESPHVMLAGEGAETFAADQALELVEPAYFFTERRWASMARAVEAQGLPVPPRPEGAPEPEPIREGALDLMEREHAFGTVGVVAIDQSGEIVAGTSTGGTTAKQWGRIGDSPIIGAGTYANQACGLSATGTGEFFIRLNIAARICTAIERAEADGEADAQAIADRVIQDELAAMGGDGGIVMLHRDRPVWSFNTPGMYRAALVAGGEPVVAIYGDEE
ncbi:isoaspartyl peptidase/L-asparaginase [Marinicauda salina]|uniref:Isoaspartyl peptidase n=1 Tax=Marinicauda salina TaxID=2135793 RepID=A0A2U2BTR6_9PROT|nr:isoaspartyl peptidase/L-asparaginase [Marinicauda salina]PWE17397.1 isoaspartyl peptidase/L-asparaginase [Marinicauda salina]